MILAFITVSAILRSVNLLVVLAGMMIAPLLLSWRSQLHNLKSLICKRIVPQHIHAGQIVNFQWECRNTSSRLNAWNILISDTLQRSEDPDDRIKKDRKRDLVRTSVSFPQICIGQSSYVSYKTLFSNRGIYKVKNAVLSTTFPFGLMRCHANLGMPRSLIVFPRIGTLSASWDRRLQSVAAGSEALKRRRGIEEDEFYALREWRSGDNRRHIHWRTSAKLGQPMVRQFDQRSNRDLAMVLDLFTDGEFAEFDSWSTRCETVLSFASTVLAKLGTAVQGQVAFGICGNSSEILTGRYQHELVMQIMRSLAVARGGMSESLGRTILELASCVSTGTPIYVVSSRARPEGFSKWGLTESERTSLLPILRWLHVRSAEFAELFTENSENNERQIQQLQQKWVSDADD